MAKNQKNLKILDKIIYSFLIGILVIALVFYCYLVYAAGSWKRETFDWKFGWAFLPGTLIVSPLIYLAVRRLKRILQKSGSNL
jgi:biotin transporter BioY